MNYNKIEELERATSHTLKFTETDLENIIRFARVESIENADKMRYKLSLGAIEKLGDLIVEELEENARDGKYRYSDEEFHKEDYDLEMTYAFPSEWLKGSEPVTRINRKENGAWTLEIMWATEK